MNTETRLSAVGTIEKVARSDLFLAELADTDQGPGRKVKALSRAAHILAAIEDDTLPTLEQHSLNVLSRIPGFLVAQNYLNDVRDGRLGYDSQRFDDSKKSVIEFNHAVRSLIDSNPGLTFGEVLSFMSESALRTMGPEALKLMQRSGSEALSAMRHEIAVEQAIGQLFGPGGIDNYEGSSVAEERLGIDLICYMRDGRTVYIDVKSGPEGRDIAIEKMRLGGPIPVWSGLRFEDFGPRMRLSSSEIAAKVVPQIREALGIEELASS